MRVFVLAWFLGILTLLSGCRFRDPSIDLLHGELRWMEDQLFMLESELEGTCNELAHCQQSCQPTSAAATPEPRPRPTVQRRKLSLPRRDSPVMPEIVMPPKADVVQPNLIEDGPYFGEPTYEPLPDETFQAPAMDVPQVPEDPIVNPQDRDIEPQPGLGPGSENSPEADTGSNLDEGELPPPTAQPPVQPPAYDSPFPAEPTLTPPSNEGLDTDLLENTSKASAARGTQDLYSIRLQSHLRTEPIDAQVENKSPRPAAEPVVDAHVTHIVTSIEPQTGFAHKPGVKVVIEPRNADGAYVALPAPVSVVVLDGSRQGPDARIGRWDLTVEETAASLTSGRSGKQRSRGIHLQLDWPEGAPRSEDLRVYIRYVSVDGRKLESQQRLAASDFAEKSPWSVEKEATLRNGWSVVKHQEEVAEKPVEKKSGWSVVPKGPAEPARFDDSILTHPQSGTQKVTKMDTEDKPTTSTSPSPWQPFRSGTDG